MNDYVCMRSFQRDNLAGSPTPLFPSFFIPSFLVQSGPYPSATLVEAATGFRLGACVDEKSLLCRGIDRFSAAHR